MKPFKSVLIASILSVGITAQYGCAQGYRNDEGYNRGGHDRGYNNNRGGAREMRDQIERGGWSVAYSAQMTERDAAYGNVEPGLSVFESDRREIREWAERILNRSLSEMENRFRNDAGLLRYDEDTRKDVRRFFVRNVSALLRSRQGGEEIMRVRDIEVKAGVMEYFSRRDNEKVIVPYLGLRIMRY